MLRPICSVGIIELVILLSPVPRELYNIGSADFEIGDFFKSAAIGLLFRLHEPDLFSFGLCGRGHERANSVEHDFELYVVFGHLAFERVTVWLSALVSPKTTSSSFRVDLL